MAITAAQLQITVALMNGNVPERKISDKWTITCKENMWHEFEVPAETELLDAVVLQTGGLTNAKLLLVKGGQGVGFYVGNGTELHAADPIGALSATAGLEATTELRFVNSSTQPRTVTVIGIE